MFRPAGARVLHPHFLELGEKHSERELERALIGRIEDFLRSLGGLFTFVGSQFRLEVEDEEYFIDLLLYHRRLHCLVAIELKVGKFQPEFVGTIVEYALSDAVKPIGVATYRIFNKLPDELKGQLPSPAEIAKLLEEVPDSTAYAQRSNPQELR